MRPLITFDLDGTLVDSLRDLTDAANELLDGYGAPALAEHAVGAMVGEGAATLVKRLLAASGLPVPPDQALPRFLEIYDRRLVNWTRPYDGIPEALERIAQTAALAVLTNKPGGASERILAALELRRHFRWVIGGDTPLGRKPHPQGFRTLMERAGVSPGRAVLVGDSSVDVQTARNAEGRVCVARWGFGFRSLPPGLLSADDLLVDRPSDLPSVLEAFATGSQPSAGPDA